MINAKNVLKCCIVALCCSFGYGQAFHKPTPTPYQDWDYLVFSQRWPITGCMQWEEAKKDNTCSFPKDRSQWTVHGVWPTKTGKNGPYFCNSAIHFNPDQLQPFMDDLKNFWTNVEANTKPNSLWQHEWNKHGTCATSDPLFNSIPNYFQMGIYLAKLYDLAKILSNKGIVPNKEGYAVDVIYNTVKTALNKNPIIECVVDRTTNNTYISEIRVCLNKTLELIDCDVSNAIHSSKVPLLINCSTKKMVMYTDSVPSFPPSYEVDYNDDMFVELQEHYDWQQHYIKMYKFIKFLAWYTL